MENDHNNIKVNVKQTRHPWCVEISPEDSGNDASRAERTVSVSFLDFWPSVKFNTDNAEIILNNGEPFDLNKVMEWKEKAELLDRLRKVFKE